MTRTRLPGRGCGWQWFVEVLICHWQPPTPSPLTTRRLAVAERLRDSVSFKHSVKLILCDGSLMTVLRKNVRAVVSACDSDHQVL